MVGLALAAHGAQKLFGLFGLFGGPGIAGTGGFFGSIGFRPGRLFATMAGLGETGGGMAFALGLLAPLASAIIVATMVVAIWGVHRERGFFAQDGGYEYPLSLAAIAAAAPRTGRMEPPEHGRCAPHPHARKIERQVRPPSPLQNFPCRQERLHRGAPAWRGPGGCPLR